MESMTNPRLELIDAALEQRNSECVSYEVNIANYRRMLTLIDERHQDDADLAGPFRDEIQGRLDAEIIQYRRSVLIRDAILAERETYQPTTQSQ